MTEADRIKMLLERQLRETRHDLHTAILQKDRDWPILDNETIALVISDYERIVRDLEDTLARYKAQLIR